MILVLIWDVIISGRETFSVLPFLPFSFLSGDSFSTAEKIEREKEKGGGGQGGRRKEEGGG